MKILFVASEASPFIKSGGLGDVVGALPKNLVNLGFDVRVVIPKYRDISDKYKSQMKYIKNFNVEVGWRNQYCGVFELNLDGAIYYFIDNEYYFLRGGMYGYGDDGERFCFYDKAVLSMIKEIGFRPDIIHCHDWQTGMIPVLLREQYMWDEYYRNIKTVFTIHNLAFQGVYGRGVLTELLNLGEHLFDNGALEHYGNVNFMKGAISYADNVTTVSETYANEIQTPEFGETLDGLLRYKKFNLKGILNGIDYDEYNPKEDRLIYANYDIENIVGKEENKINLQKELGLKASKDIPLMGLVSRLTNQKGVDLVINLINSIMDRDEVQLVILGTGDANYENHLKHLEYVYKGKLCVNTMFSNSLAHKIYAACDIFLMPSLFEPCGLGQLIALRYGSLPIVRETGGLKDTITPYNKFTGEGNGFSFKDYNSNDFIYVVNEALELYKDKEKWNNIVVNAMSSKNSWEGSASEYIKLYEAMGGIRS